MNLQDVSLVEELRKNKIEDNFRLLEVIDNKLLSITSI